MTFIPKCIECGKRLPLFHSDLVTEQRGYLGLGFFCCQRHGWRWAIRILGQKECLRFFFALRSEQPNKIIDTIKLLEYNQEKEGRWK